MWRAGAHMGATSAAPSHARQAPHPTRYLPLQRPAPTPARHGFGAWLHLHKSATAGVVATLLLSGAAVAVLTMQISTAVTPSAKAPPVVFASGSDYTSINGAGFATLTLGTSATSATLAVSGVPGAASVTLG